MRKASLNLLPVAFVVLVTLWTAQALAADAFDLRKTPWGQPMTETFRVFGHEVQPADTALALKGPELKGWQTTVSYVYEQGKLALIGQRIGADENPGLDAGAVQALQAALMADMDAAHSRVHPQIPAWKNADGDYMVLSREAGKPGEASANAGEALVLRHLPESTWQAHYAARVPPAPAVSPAAATADQPAQAVFAPALKGLDAAFEAGVKKRLAERFKATPVEPLADFAMDTTNVKDAITAAYRLRKGPLTLAPLQKDAQEVVAMMVRELLDLGINPGTEKLMVSLRVYLPEKGLTGQDNVRVLGRARYNPLTDSVEWLPAGK